MVEFWRTEKNIIHVDKFEQVLWRPVKSKSKLSYHIARINYAIINEYSKSAVRTAKLMKLQVLNLQNPIIIQPKCQKKTHDVERAKPKANVSTDFHLGRKYARLYICPRTSSVPRSEQFIESEARGIKL